MGLSEKKNRRGGSDPLCLCVCHITQHKKKTVYLLYFFLDFFVVVDAAVVVVVVHIYYSDNRLNHLPFMANPISMVLLISTYLYVIRNGKKFMEPQKPYNIEKIIIVYNILQIITNIGLFLTVSTHHPPIPN